MVIGEVRASGHREESKITRKQLAQKVNLEAFCVLNSFGCVESLGTWGVQLSTCHMVVKTHSP